MKRRGGKEMDKVSDTRKQYHCEKVLFELLDELSPGSAYHIINSIREKGIELDFRNRVLVGEGLDEKP